MAMSYAEPISIRRPAKSHRFDVYSPELGRALTLFSRGQLDQWVLLEATPAVLQFCERPIELKSKRARKRLVEFWARHQDYDEFIVLVDAQAPENDYQAPPDVRVRCVTRDELAQQRTYIAKLRSMLPYVTAYRRWMKDEHLARARELCTEQTALARLEHALSAQDPLWARTVVFTAVVKGVLGAPTLAERAWDASTVVSRIDHGR
jgi:hypothetical protein